MGYYSDQIPDFRQAVEKVLADHGLISDPTPTGPAGDSQQTGDQSAGQHVEPTDQPA